MRAKLLVVLLDLVFCFCTISALAQTEKQKAQSYIVIEFVVKPGKIADFEAAYKESLDEVKEQGYYLPIYVYSMEFPHYYAFYPVPLYSGLDDFFAAYVEYVQKMGIEKLQKIHEREYASIEYYKMFLIRYREDLSLHPEIPKYRPEQEQFTHWGLCYIQPGKEQKFEESFKAIKSMYSEKNLKDIDYGWDMYVGDIGTEMPFYFFSEYGESKAHFWTQAEKRHEAVGQKLFDLFDGVLAACREFVFKGGQFRPDLSYLPKEK
ncbi:MAG: hypothetical protein ACFFDT_28420 [Candidatus Hodarchaeota archaeon]